VGKQGSTAQLSGGAGSMPLMILDVLLLDAVHSWFVEERLALMLRLRGLALKVLGMINTCRIEGSNSLTESQLIPRLAPADVAYLRSALSFLGGFSSQAIKELYEDGPKVVNVTAFQLVSAKSVEVRLERLRSSSRFADVSKAFCPPAWLPQDVAHLNVELQRSRTDAKPRPEQHELTPRKVERGDAKRRRVLRRASSGSSAKLPPPCINRDTSRGAAATFVDDPEDQRFSVGSAVLKGGKLDLNAYADLKSHFAVEPECEEHPDPQKPGMRRHELSGDRAVILEGLRPWSDAKGKGWMVQRKLSGGKMESRYMSAITWRSWRLAFLLARLQWDVWAQRVAGVAS